MMIIITSSCISNDVRNDGMLRETVFLQSERDAFLIGQQQRDECWPSVELLRRT